MEQMGWIDWWKASLSFASASAGGRVIAVTAPNVNCLQFDPPVKEKWKQKSESERTSRTKTATESYTNLVSDLEAFLAKQERGS